MSAQLY